MKLKFVIFLTITLSIASCEKDDESLLTKNNTTLNQTESNTIIQDSILDLDNNLFKSTQSSLKRGWNTGSNKQA